MNRSSTAKASTGGRSSQLVLTKAGGRIGAGSSFYASPVTTSGLTAAFTTSIDGGTGANGMTFALLDPSKATATAVGQAGSGLGFVGLPGVAVAMSTWQSSGAPSANFAGVTVSTTTTTGDPTFLSTTTAIPNLRTGTHNWTVTVTAASHLVVTCDGVQILDQAVTVTPTALVGFTGANGGSDDNHTVTTATITAP